VPEAGDLIAGRYRLVVSVGRGSMGVVWQAVDERLDRPVAVKLFDATTHTPDAVERIMREGRVAARLRHPHAITVHDVVEHDGIPCLVLEYLPSRSLAAVIAERGSLPQREVAAVGAQVASGLAAVHEAGIVHRDVTPYNVLLAEDGTAKIADFGIARALGEGTVTDAKVIVGTPAFLSPEIAAGGQATVASDVFSLGATLYAALEGSPPFGSDENPYALLRRVASGQITAPSTDGPLTEVVTRLLRGNPAERPTMAQTHELLAAVVEGRPVPSRAERHGTLLLPAPRHLPRRLIATIAAACLLAAGIVIGVVLRNDDQPAGAQPIPSPSTSPPATSTTPTAACDARYELTDSWPDGYNAQITVHNADKRDLTGWTVTWEQPAGHKIGNLWNGVLRQDATSVTVTNADYNAKLPVGGTTNFGFTAAGPAPDRPTVTCTSPP
jgi:serine/threonine protein kinase